MFKHSRRGPFAALFVIITLHTSGYIKYVVWWMTEDSVFVFVGPLARSASVCNVFISYKLHCENDTQQQS